MTINPFGFKILLIAAMLRPRLKHSNSVKMSCSVVWLITAAKGGPKRKRKKRRIVARKTEKRSVSALATILVIYRSRKQVEQFLRTECTKRNFNQVSKRATHSSTAQTARRVVL